MKIFRSIFLELLWNTLLAATALAAVAALLRFSRYLDSAADGDVAVSALLPALLWRLPEFFSLLLPLGLLLGVLFLLGRMRADGELVILSNCGIGPARLLLYCQCAAAALLVALLFLGAQLAPFGRASAETLLHTPRIAEQLQTLASGRFFRAGGAALYVERAQHGERGARLRGVFLAAAGEKGAPAVTVAADGALHAPDDAGLSLRLENGVSWRPLPGADGGFDLDRFRRLDYPLSVSSGRIAETDLRAASSRALAAADDPAARAMLHWRLSLPLLAPLAALFGFALAAPGAARAPRISWSLALGALGYFLYVYVFNLLRDLSVAGQAPLLAPLYLHLHLPALALGLLLLRRNLQFPRAAAECAP